MHVTFLGTGVSSPYDYLVICGDNIFTSSLRGMVDHNWASASSRL